MFMLTVRMFMLTVRTTIKANKLNNRDGDFPNIQDYKRYLAHLDFSSFPDPNIANQKTRELETYLNKEFKSILDPISLSVGLSNMNTNMGGGDNNSFSSSSSSFSSSEALQTVQIVTDRKKGKGKGSMMRIFLLVVPILLVMMYFVLNRLGYDIPSLSTPQFAIPFLNRLFKNSQNIAAINATFS